VIKLSVNGDNCDLSASPLLPRQNIVKAIYEVFLGDVLGPSYGSLK